MKYNETPSSPFLLFGLFVTLEGVAAKEFGLTVVVVAAKNLKNVSTFGKLDPFVQITYEKDVYKASVIKDGGCSPVWNYEVCLTGKTAKLRIDVMDSRIFKPKLIGSVTVDISKLGPGVQNLAFNLYDEGDKKTCTGVLFTKFTIFSLSRNLNVNRIPHSLSTPVSWPCCSHSPHVGYPSYSPEYSPSTPIHNRAMYLNSSPVITTPVPYPYGMAPVQSPPLQRRTSAEGSSYYLVSRTPSMTPEMFPIIPQN